MDTACGADPGASSAAHWMSRPATLLLATRPAFLSVTLVAVLIGWATVYRRGLPIDPLLAGASLLGALLLHAAANVLNDYYDHLSGCDAANVDRVAPYTGGSRFIQEGRLSPRQTAQLGYGLLGAALPLGLWLVAIVGLPLLAIGLAGVLLAWAYSAPPFRLQARGLGELAIAAAWLLVVVGADAVQRRELSVEPVVTGLSYALMVAAVLFVNQFPDLRADAHAGKRTVVVRLGPQTAKWGLYGLCLAALIWVVLMIGRNHLPQLCGVSLFVLPLIAHASRELVAHADEPAGLRPVIRTTLLATHLHGLLMAAALAWSAAAWR